MIKELFISIKFAVKMPIMIYGGNRQMGISAQSIILAERDFIKCISDGRGLKPGNRLRGRVLNIQKNGRLVMDFGNFRALARANFPVNSLLLPFINAILGQT